MPKLTIEYDLKDVTPAFAVEVIIASCECNMDLVSKITYGEDLDYDRDGGFYMSKEIKQAKGYKALRNLLEID